MRGGSEVECESCCPSIEEAIKQAWCDSECLSRLVSPSRFGEFGVSTEAEPPFAELLEGTTLSQKDAGYGTTSRIRHALNIIDCKSLKPDFSDLECLRVETSEGRILGIEIGRVTRSRLGRDDGLIRHRINLDLTIFKDKECCHGRS